jgi:hypothetical protein
MNTSRSEKSKRSSFCRRSFLLAAVAITSATGCQNITRRGQSPDEGLNLLTDTQPDSTKYVGAVTGVWGMNYASIEGVGLAGGLKNSGSNPAPGWQVEHLVRELKSREDLDNPKALLASKDTSLVLVKGHLPPGIRKGDNFDLEIRTLPKSETSSLFAGQLSRTRLRTMAVLGRKVREGQVLGVAQGGILIDSLFETRQDQSNQVRGLVLGGGIALEDRPLGLTIRADGHTYRQATEIAKSVNDRFTTIDNNGRIGVARAKSDKLIELQVPENYRHNVMRFVQVVQNTAYEETVNERVERLSQLERELGNPETCATAAARLESMGEESIPTLTRALRHPELEIRFHASQALAYLGESACVDVLKETAEIEPAFRWHALTALASLQASSAGEALKELMHSESAEARYGAFRSMKARSPNDHSVAGDWLAQDFYFHVIPSKTTPMIHASRSKVPEIVLFGEGQSVSEDFFYVESGLTIKGDGKGNVRIIRYVPGQDEIREVSSTMLSELIPALSRTGCNYSVLLRMLQDAKQNDMLQTRLAFDAIPKRRRKYANKESSENERSSRYVAGPMPDLFRPGQGSEQTSRRDDVARLTSLNEADGQKTQTGIWSKLNDRLKRN